MSRQVLAAVFVLAAPSAEASVVISSKPTSNMDCSGGVCTATAAKAVLNAGQLAGMLAGGDVTVESGSLAQDIEVDAMLSWTGEERLTLDAWRGIAVNKPVVVSGTGALTIATNDGGTGGGFSFGGAGHVEFWDLSSGLTVDGADYTLVGDVTSLAQAIASNPAGRFALSRSYDAKHDHAYTSSPVGTEFAGVFEGLGNTISNLRINSADSGFELEIGMFSVTAPGAVLRDVRLAHESVKATGGPDSVGGLVGQSNGTIFGVEVDATIAAPFSPQTGGVAGGSFGGAIVDTASSGSVQGTGAVGGIVGNMSGSSLSFSHSSATVTASTGNVGGVAGVARSSSQLPVDHCFATGDVSGAVNSSVGGLVGYSSVMILTHSYATGSATAGDGGYAGGLAGRPESTIIRDTYAMGHAAAGADGFAGGLVGYKSSETSTSYSTGMVTGGTGSVLGGVIGVDATRSNIHLYWDLETSGIDNPRQGAGNVPKDGGIKGLTTAKLTSGLPGGFDKSVWARKDGVNGGFPYLKDMPPK